MPASVIVAGAVCSVLPDLDVLFLRLGAPHDSLLGHRGITHSLSFAAGVSAAALLALRHRAGASSRILVWLYLFVATASHGVLDAFTNGGHGVAFLAPFSNGRYFFPYRPIEVSPLALDRFLSDRGAAVLASEAVWVWTPSMTFALVVLSARRLLSRNRPASRFRSDRGVPADRAP